MMYEKKLVKERNGWKMWRDWVSEEIERMMWEYDNEGMTLDGWKCYLIEGEGERGWMIMDRNGKGVCMCDGIEDAEFKVVVLKMKEWEERSIVKMCERKRERNENREDGC